MNSNNNIYLSSILEKNQWSLAQKKKRIMALLAKLAGDDCPIEALALIMVTDLALCKQQDAWLYDIIKLLHLQPEKMKQKYGISHIDLKQALIESRMIKISSKLMHVQLQMWKFNSKKNEQKKISKVKEEDHLLTRIRIHVLVIISHLSTNEVLNDSICLKHLSEKSLYSSIIQCIQSDPSTVVVCYAVNVLVGLIEKVEAFRDFFAHQEDISKLGHLLYKDILSIKMLSNLKTGFTSYEKTLLTSIPKGLDMVTLILPIIHGAIEVNQDKLKEYALIWSYITHKQCGRAISLTISHLPVKKRIKLILEDERTCKALMSWSRTPSVCIGDVERLISCMRLFSYFTYESELITTKLCQIPDFIRILELGARHPSITAAEANLRCVAVMAKNSITARRLLVANKIIVRSAINSCYSFQRDLQETAIRTICSMADVQTAKQIVQSGFGLKSLIFLHYYYDIGYASNELFMLRRTLEKGGGSIWKKQEKQLMQHKDIRSPRAIEIMKSSGNESYRNGSYEHAIEMYTDGIEVCPPAKYGAPLVLNLEVNFSGTRETQWYSLPAVLLSNRAQCYIHLKMFDKAIFDCDRAIGHCCDDSPEGKTLLLKTALRRSTAFYELGKLEEAMVDVAYCLSQDQQNQGFRKHFNEVYTKYRQHFGTKYLIRRCIVCLKGEGEKLKRCANCEERYCSRECQMLDWEDNHKNTCNIEQNNLG